MDVESQLAAYRRGAVSLVEEGELRAKIETGRPLRVKLGVDPTSPDLHLGHSVVLSKLRAFQDFGHTAVLIIGDFTAMVGDPSGRDATRPTLSAEDVKANAATYTDQAFKVLDRARTELRFNSEWLVPFMREELLATLKRHTVQQVLAREDFKKRLAEGSPLTLLETLYPILQGRDSVAVRADVELGGNDQITNLLMGRRMQADAGQSPQVALTVPLLLGTDGVRKMSKSYGNAIGLVDPPRDMFGKVMSVTDEAMWSYYEFLTLEDLAAVRAGHPMEAKKALAQSLVERFHGRDAALEERRYFDETFSRKVTPSEAREVALPPGLMLSDLVHRCGGTRSRNEARRLVAQGGVKIDGAKAGADAPVAAPETFVLQIGKHRFVRVRLVPGGGA